MSWLNADSVNTRVIFYYTAFVRFRQSRIRALCSPADRLTNLAYTAFPATAYFEYRTNQTESQAAVLHEELRGRREKLAESNIRYIWGSQGKVHNIMGFFEKLTLFCAYNEWTRSTMVCLVSSFDFAFISGKKILGLTSSALAIRSRVSTDGCFLPFSTLAKKLWDKFEVVDNSS